MTTKWFQGKRDYLRGVGGGNKSDRVEIFTIGESETINDMIKIVNKKLYSLPLLAEFKRAYLKNAPSSELFSMWSCKQDKLHIHRFAGVKWLAVQYNL